MVKFLQKSLIEANMLLCANKSFSNVPVKQGTLFYGLHIMGIVLKVNTTVALLFSSSIHKSLAAATVVSLFTLRCNSVIIFTSKENQLRFTFPRCASHCFAFSINSSKSQSNVTKPTSTLDRW